MKRSSILIVLRAILSSVFLSAATSKLFELQPFWNYFRGMPLIDGLPSLVARALLGGLIGFEIAVGVCLAIGVAVSLASAFTAIALVVFSVVAAPGYASQGCSCGWIPSLLTPPTAAGFLARNALLLVLASVLWRLSRLAPRPSGSMPVLAPVATALLAIVGTVFIAGTGAETELERPLRGDSNGPAGEPTSQDALLAMPTVSRSTRSAGALPPQVRTRAVTLVDPHNGEPGVLIVGEVIDLYGEPVAEAVLSPLQDAEQVWGRSDRSGRFALVWIPGSGCIQAHGEGFATILACCPNGPHDVEYRIVVARTVQITGMVLDDEGRPVEGARLWLSVDPDRFRAGGSGDLAASRVPLVNTLTDADGLFRFSQLVTGEGILLGVQKEGFEEQLLDVPGTDREDWVIPLESSADSARVSGRVLHVDGTPAPGATVRYGTWCRTTSDDGGYFRLGLVDIQETGALTAALPGYQLASLTGFLPAGGEHEGMDGIILRLGPPAREISGRVLEPDGTGGKGWLVSISNGTPVSFHDSLPEFAEEACGQGASHQPTDERGRFRLSGLSDRTYDLHAYHPSTGRLVISKGIAAGAEGVILQATGLKANLRGIVRSLGGQPLAGLHVSARTGLSGDLGVWLGGNGPETSTGSDGRFQLKQVPLEHLYMSVEGSGVMPALKSIPSAEVAGDELELTVQATCAFVLEGDPPVSTAGVRFESGDRRGLPILLPGGYSAQTVDLPEKLGVLLAVPEVADTMVLLGPDGGEIERRSVRLSPVATTRLNL